MPERPGTPPTMKKVKKSHRDLPGLRFGKLIVCSRNPNQVNGFVRWDCICDCGAKTVVRALSLLSNRGVKSCGCLQREVTSNRQLIHGHAKKHNFSPEYKAWAHMLNRCINPNDGHYHNYGGRGITVCDQWKQFLNFLKDVGLRPSVKHSIDRINNEGNYEPGNVRWATAKQQMRNRRGLHLLTYNGKTQCLAEWSDEIGSPRELIRSRLRLGWDAQEALFTPKYASR